MLQSLRMLQHHVFMSSSDFVHITDNVIYLQAKWKNPKATFSKSILSLSKLTWIMYSWFGHIIRNKCEQLCV